MAERVPVLAANWKMHKTPQEAVEFMEAFLSLVSGTEGREVVIAPSFVCIERVAAAASGSGVEVAAQNLYFEPKGAFTGEVSPGMVRAAGARWVIVGHSERRHIFGEDDGLIAKKVKAAVDAGLSVFFCIGERLEERESGDTGLVLSRQIRRGLELLSPEDFSSVVVAYEPVWAIGTGRTASLEQISEAHALVRSEVAGLAGSDVADRMRILYGGSVKPANVKGIMSLDDVDGALVGGASLEPESFARIVKFEEAE